MLDEYDYWSSYINRNDRALNAVWDGSDYRQEQQYIEWNNSTNLSPCNETSTWTAAIVEHAYLETMMVFLFAIILYLTLVVCYCEREREITKHEVDKSVITKRVLPHGQSQNFNNPITEDETTKNCCCSSCFIVRCCSRRKQNKKQIHPHPAAAESASEILGIYRSAPERNKSQSMCAHCNHQAISDVPDDCPQARTDDDSDCSIDIALAEEGLGGFGSNRLTCPICFEPFLVEENVTWSRIGHCRHVFHYDCILPWAVLGNFECPVCREAFWSKSHHPAQRCLPIGRLDAEMRQSRFCVQHGLISP